MNNEEIISARTKYNDLLKKRRKLIQLRNRITELNKDSKVKEYISICKELGLLNDIIIPTNQDLLYEAFDEIASNTKETCNIYVYLGLKSSDLHTYNGQPYFLTIDERRILKHLETGQDFTNYAHKKNYFNDNFEIINCDLLNPDEEYKKIRLQYFKNLLTCDQEEAIKKLIKN